MNTNRILTLLLLFLIICNNYTSSQEIIRAAKKNSLYSVKKCIEEGCNINVTNRKNETALIVASKAGNIFITSELIENGAYLDQKDRQGLTALIIACQEDHKYSSWIANDLMKNGANLDIKDNKGQTALHIAAEKGKYSIVRSLIKYGADITLQDANGEDAYSIALRNQDSYVIRECFKFGSVDSSLIKHLSPIYYSSPEAPNQYLVKMRIDKGYEADISSRRYDIEIDDDNRTYEQNAFLTPDIKHEIELDFSGYISWKVERKRFNYKEKVKLSIPINCKGNVKIEFTPKRNKEYILELSSDNTSGISHAKTFYFQPHRMQ